MVPGIVFDMDGVLIDSERLVLRAWEEVARECGLPCLRELFYQCIGVTHTRTAELFNAFCGGSMEYENFRGRVRERYLDFIKDGVPIKSGAVELLTWLRGEGWRIGLASSSREASVCRAMNSTGLRPFFHTLICGDMLTASKPEPDIYLRACTELGVSPARTFAVEDSLNGVRSASRAGMKTLLVPDLIEPNREMRALALRIFPDLGAVLHWLKEAAEGTLRASSGVQEFSGTAEKQ